MTNNTARLQLGYSPLTKTIQLAKMRDLGPLNRERPLKPLKAVWKRWPLYMMLKKHV